MRVELRQRANWTADEAHALVAEVKAVSQLVPDKLTLLQIHGIGPDGGNAPPLLRIAMNHGDLYAFIKTSADGDKTDSLLLERGVAGRYFIAEVAVNARRLVIRINRQEKVNRDIAYWPFENYFKAGCYPQARQGRATVTFRSLTVR